MAILPPICWQNGAGKGAEVRGAFGRKQSCRLFGAEAPRGGAANPRGLIGGVGADIDIGELIVGHVGDEARGHRTCFNDMGERRPRLL